MKLDCDHEITQEEYEKEYYATSRYYKGHKICTTCANFEAFVKVPYTGKVI